MVRATLKSLFCSVKGKQKEDCQKNIKKISENFPCFIKKLWESYSSDGICAIMMKVY